MSVVCYDGELLAADRKSRLADENGVKQLKSLKRDKITVDVGDSVFDGEKVYAIGRVGRLKISKAMIDCLKRSKDLATTISTLGDKMAKKFEGTSVATTSLMIVTSGHVHVVTMNKKFQVKSRKYHRSEKIAIGSGKVIAQFLMDHLGHSATDAVCAMELSHECCGGGATYTSRLQSVMSKPILTIDHRDHRTLTRQFLKSTVRAAKDKLAALPID